MIKKEFERTDMEQTHIQEFNENGDVKHGKN